MLLTGCASCPSARTPPKWKKSLQTKLQQPCLFASPQEFGFKGTGHCCREHCCLSQELCTVHICSPTWNPVHDLRAKSTAHQELSAKSSSRKHFKPSCNKLEKAHDSTVRGQGTAPKAKCGLCETFNCPHSRSSCQSDLFLSAHR